MRSLAIVKDLGEAAESVSRAVCRVAVDVREGVWSLLRHSGKHQSASFPVCQQLCLYSVPHIIVALKRKTCRKFIAEIL